MPVTKNINDIDTSIAECIEKLKNFQGNNQEKKVSIRQALAKKLKDAVLILEKIKDKKTLKKTIKLNELLVEVEEELGWGRDHSEHRLATAYFELAMLYMQHDTQKAIYSYQKSYEHISKAIKLDSENKHHRNFHRMILNKIIQVYENDDKGNVENMAIRVRLYEELSNTHQSVYAYQKTVAISFYLAKFFNIQINKSENVVDKIKSLSNSFYYIKKMIVINATEHFDDFEKFVYFYRNLLNKFINDSDDLTIKMNAYTILLEMSDLFPRVIDSVDIGCNFAYFKFENNLIEEAFDEISKLKKHLGQFRILKCYVTITEFYAKSIHNSNPKKAIELYHECIAINDFNFQLMSYCYAGLASTYLKYGNSLLKDAGELEESDEYVNLSIGFFKKAINLGFDESYNYSHMLINAFIAYGRIQEKLYKKYQHEPLLTAAKTSYENAISTALSCKEFRKAGDAYYQLGEFFRYQYNDSKSYIENLKLSIENLLQGKLTDDSLNTRSCEIYLQQYHKALKIINPNDLACSLRDLRKDILAENFQQKLINGTNKRKSSSFFISETKKYKLSISESTSVKEDESKLKIGFSL